MTKPRYRLNYNADIDRNVILDGTSNRGMTRAEVRAALDGAEMCILYISDDGPDDPMRFSAGWPVGQKLCDQLNDIAKQADTNGDPTMTTPDPLSLDRFTVRLDEAIDQVVIVDRDMTPLTGIVADRILGDREAAVIWSTSDRYGYIVFPTTDAGWEMATALADQLNDLDAEADAAQTAALIDSAASLAERIDASDADAGRRQRAIAAYQRAADLPPYPWPSGCSDQYLPGDRVRIGDPEDEYRCGVMVGLRLPAQLQGQTGTVILPHRPGCPLIVLLDDDSDVVELPCSGLYVRRVGGEE